MDKNVTSFSLDLLVKGSLFIWLYRALGITELVSFPSLFLAIAVDLGVCIVIAIIAAVIALSAKNQLEKRITEFYEQQDDDYYYD